jgi:pilus assembly protein CpaB
MSKTPLSGTSRMTTQRFVLIAGVVCGLIAAILVFVIVAQSGGSDDGSRSVVVAKQDIPAQSRLIADVLDVKTLSADEVEPEAFTARSQVVNRITGQAITAGDQILPTMVSDRAGESLAFTIGAGKRAISIEVQESVTAGGNVQPGDQVDVVGIFALDKDADVSALLAVVAPGGDAVVTPLGTDRNLTVTLLQDVKVLAVGQSLAKSEEETTTRATQPETDSEGRPKAKSVTLEVTPQQAQLLALADEYAVVRLAVRAFGDQGPVGIAPMITVFKKR